MVVFSGEWQPWGHCAIAIMSSPQELGSVTLTGQADNSHDVETILTGTSQPFIKTIEERSGLELVGRMFT